VLNAGAILCVTSGMDWDTGSW